MELSPTIQLNRNGRSRRSKLAHGDDADARYAAALNLVRAIDRDLQKGTRHYYDTQGRLLVSLDEVIQAILKDTLVVGKRGEALRDSESIWSPVGELIA